MIAGCIGTGPVAQIGTQDAVQDAAPPEPQPFPIGLTLGVGSAANTAVLDVNVLSAQVTKSYTSDDKTVTAPAGKTFIVIEAEIKQKGPLEIEVGRGKFFATDADMFDKYPSSYAGTDGLVGSTILTGGESITGKAAFEVPEGLQGMKVVYEFGADITVTNMVAWNLP